MEDRLGVIEGLILAFYRREVGQQIVKIIKWLTNIRRKSEKQFQVIQIIE